MAPHDDLAALRRCTFAVCVTYDIDLVPHDNGVLLPSAGLVGWSALARAVGTVDVDSDAARARLAEWLWLRETVSTLDAEQIARSARVVGVPVDSELHPGAPWVREHVPGGALDLGLGLLGADRESSDAVVPVPESVLRDAGLSGAGWWPAARQLLDEMGLLAADRRKRDPDAPLRPMGDADVVTLLGTAGLRGRLAAEQPDGLATVVVPLRTRGWAPATRVDPAFGPAAARIAEPVERGFSRPLLATREELCLVAAGGEPVRQVVRDSADDGLRRLGAARH